MKKQSYSFINLVTINVGSMIGVGIFFKNPGILRTTNNIYLALATWAIGAVLVYGLCLSFAEAQSYTGKNNISGTVPNWVTQFCGKTMGRISQQIMSWVYYPVFSSLLVYYAVYFAFTGLGWKGADIESKWIIIYGATTLAYLALTIGNVMSYSFGKALQFVGTVIKFIPLLLVCVLGFIAPVASSDANTFAGIVNGKAQTWNFGSIFLAIPAVFFAFDGFMGGLNLSKEEEKPNDATKASLFSVVSVAIFYLVFAAAVGFGTDNGSLFPVFEKTFGKKGATAIFMLIAISAYTVANGFTVAGARALKGMNDEKGFIPFKLISKVESDGRHAGQTWVLFGMGMFYMTLCFLISEASIQKAGLIEFDAINAAKLTKEATFDNFGTAGAQFAFGLYALVALGVFANRFSNRLPVIKQKWIGLQVSAAVLALWVVVMNIIGYFLASAKITMWLVILSLFITYVANNVVKLSQTRK